MICPKCKTDGLTVDDFNKDSSKKNGLRGECKLCQRERSKQYRKRYYMEKKDEILSYQKKYYEAKKDGKNIALNVC